MTGVLFIRKMRGRKYSFVWGGCTLAQALQGANPSQSVVFAWKPHDGGALIEWCSVNEAPIRNANQLPSAIK